MTHEQALGGILVVELGETVAIQACGRWLADAGALVVKIEPPEGDPLRHRGPFLGRGRRRASLPFESLNLGKRSVTLNPEVADGAAVLKRLMARADVVISSETRQWHATNRLGYRALRRCQPRLVFTTLTPFGHRGRNADHAGTELTEYHASGLGYLTPRGVSGVPRPSTEIPPLCPGATLAESYAGLHAAAATTTALVGARLHGMGARIDLSVQECLMPLLRRDIAVFHYEGRTPHRGEQTWEISPNGIRRCGDGFALISVVTDREWKQFAELIGHPEWANDSRYATAQLRLQNAGEGLDAAIDQWATSRTKAQIFEEGQRAGVPLAPVNTLEEVYDCPQLIGSSFWIAGRSGARFAGPAMRSDEPRPSGERSAPLLGEANTEIFRDLLGLGDADLRRLASRGAVPRDESRGMGLEIAPAAGFIPWCHDRQQMIDGPDHSPSGRPGARPRLPLSGIRVLDFGHVWAGPYAAQLLCHAGAEVIKIESSRHLDVQRGQGPYRHGQAGVNRSGVFSAQNSGKLSCCLDLKTDRGREIARRLVSVSDGLIENFRPRVMRSLGLAYEDLVDMNPRLIMVSISGYGSSGPYRDFVAYGPTVEAFGGIADVTGYCGGAPASMGGGFPDTAAAVWAAHAFTTALLQVQVTGRGQHIEVSQLEATASLLTMSLAESTAPSRRRRRDGNRVGHMAPHGVFRCAGPDRWVAIAVRDRGDWRALRAAMGNPPALASEELESTAVRIRRADAIEREIAAWTRNRTPEEVVECLQAVEVPATLVRSVADLVNDPHLADRSAFATVAHPETESDVLYTPTWTFADNKRELPRRAPLLGEHSHLVLTRILGMSEDDVDALANEGVIQ